MIYNGKNVQRLLMFSITHLLRLPIICALCSQYHQGKLAVCNACCEFLQPLGALCQHCAIPLPDDLHLVCGNCCKQRPLFDRAMIGFLFEEPLRTLLHEFKYHEGLYLSSFFTHLMLKNISDDLMQTQCLIPVPMHTKRLKSRGYNQAVLIAKQLSFAIKRPYDIRLCKRIINTEPQAELNAHQRFHNLKNAFQTKPIPYRHVTIIDDLLTTGSTANALAYILKKQGATRVDLWCCAKAITKR